MIIQNLETHIREAGRTAREVFEEIHSWPELGNEEFKTATLIGKRLKGMGLEIERPLATAVIADIKGTGRIPGDKRKKIAFRAELDALSVTEEAMVSYRSRRAGVMHACGHDAHAAILVGLAQALCRLRSVLPCDVRLIFQPDEEGEGGARRLMDKNVLKGVDQIYGFHVKPELPAGTIGIQFGAVHGESLVFRAEVFGAAAHGAKPEQGKDAIYAAAEYISMCQGILSRDLPPGRTGVITFGTVQGGRKRNILAEHVVMEGIVRGEDRRICSLLSERMRLLAKGLSQALGLCVQITFADGCKALINNASLVERIRKAASGKAEEIKGTSMTVDDFSDYLQQVPGGYFFLGSGFPDRDNSGLHSGSFQVNEDCLEVGIQILTELCLQTSPEAVAK